MQITKILITVLLILSIFLYGCHDQMNIETDSENSTGEESYPSTSEMSKIIPNIDDFSGEGYEGYAKNLSKIVSAYLVSYGVRTEIKNDDQRLYKLLNFIIKSDKDLATVYETRGLNSDEIREIWLDNNAPMLEINFTGDGNGPMLSKVFQILIRGSRVIYIYHSDLVDLYGESGVCGEQKWPYLDYAEAEILDQVVNSDRGEYIWLNLLETAGF